MINLDEGGKSRENQLCDTGCVGASRILRVCNLQRISGTGSPSSVFPGSVNRKCVAGCIL